MERKSMIGREIMKGDEKKENSRKRKSRRNKKEKLWKGSRKKSVKKL